jgi:hypothetical protein
MRSSSSSAQRALVRAPAPLGRLLRMPQRGQCGAGVSWLPPLPRWFATCSVALSQVWTLRGPAPAPQCAKLCMHDPSTQFQQSCQHL